MMRRPPRSTQRRSSAASDVYKKQGEDEAKKRRSEVTQEADFYGSMDGASKFVRGDAIAGILIMVINVVGGLLVGVLQHGMSMGHAAVEITNAGICATRPSPMVNSV